VAARGEEKGAHKGRPYVTRLLCALPARPVPRYR
jgi:hypothetical protein